jgi:hypothetical protein
MSEFRAIQAVRKLLKGRDTPIPILHRKNLIVHADMTTNSECLAVASGSKNVIEAVGTLRWQL